MNKASQKNPKHINKVDQLPGQAAGSKRAMKGDRNTRGNLNNMAKKGSGQDEYGDEYYEEVGDDGELVDQSQIAYQESFSSKNPRAGNKKNNDANHLLGFFTEEA